MVNFIIRGGASFLGIYALFVQIQLLREQFQGSNGTVLLAIPAVSIALALSLGVVDWAWHRSKWQIVFSGLFVFILLSAVSLTGTLGRVSDIRANRSARADQIAEQRASATKAEVTAQAAVDEATKQILDTCKSGVGPICKLWTDQLKTARSDLATAKDKIAMLPQADNSDADMQRISKMFNIDIETVERWVPVLLPVGLEAIVIVAFMIALGDLSDPNAPRRVEMVPPIPTPAFADFLAQADVEGSSVGELYRGFEEWCDKTGSTVLNVKDFSNLLATSGLTKRRVNGRMRVYR